MQRLSIRGAGGAATQGGFRLRFRSNTSAQFQHDLTDAGPAGCLPWNADAGAVAAELNALDSNGADGVSVTRTGDASDATGYGYTWHVSFRGPLVRGNVPELEALAGADAGCTALVGGVSQQVAAETAVQGGQLTAGTPNYFVRVTPLNAVGPPLRAPRRWRRARRPRRRVTCACWWCWTMLSGWSCAGLRRPAAAARPSASTASTGARTRPLPPTAACRWGRRACRWPARPPTPRACAPAYSPPPPLATRWSRAWCTLCACRR